MTRSIKGLEAHWRRGSAADQVAVTGRVPRKGGVRIVRARLRTMTPGDLAAMTATLEQASMLVMQVAHGMRQGFGATWIAKGNLAITAHTRMRSAMEDAFRKTYGHELDLQPGKDAKRKIF